MVSVRRLRAYREGAPRRVIAATIAAGEGPIAVAVRAFDLFDAATDRAVAAGIDPAPACAAGCSSCCHVHVEVTAPEILAAAAHLEATLSPEALAALRERLAARVEEVSALDDEARWAARIPCALLDEAGRCVIHPARPLRCRAFSSSDAGLCREAFAGRTEALPDQGGARARAADAVEDGYDAALAGAGWDEGGYRLEAGLALALAGEEAFSSARATK